MKNWRGARTSAQRCAAAETAAWEEAQALHAQVDIVKDCTVASAISEIGPAFEGLCVCQSYFRFHEWSCSASNSAICLTMGDCLTVGDCIAGEVASLGCGDTGSRRWRRAAAAAGCG